MAKQIYNVKRGNKRNFRLLKQPDLEYNGAKIIASHVEAVILDVGADDGDVESGIIEDFIEFLKQNDLVKRFGNSFEITPACTVDTHAQACLGARFDFYRLLSGKNRNDEDISMGSGTQWVSDVIALMKDFLLFLREKYRSNDKGGYAEYSDARLIIREGGNQIEWK